MFEQKPTPKQIQANRINAQKSTGPRSVGGKAASSMNALKSGIHAQSLVIRGESVEDLVALSAEYYDRWQPLTPEERLWLDALVRNEWLLRRLAVAEAQMWDYAIARLEPGAGPPALGRAFYSREETFERLQRRLSTTQLNCARALHELERLQKARREAPSPEQQPPESALDSKPLTTEIGFVPPNPSSAPGTTPAPHAIGFVPPITPAPSPRCGIFAQRTAQDAPFGPSFAQIFNNASKIST